MTEKSCDTLEQSEEFARRCTVLEENYKRICDRIAQAAVRSGRKPEDITLLGATKTVSPELINHAIGLGLQHIGENRVQELMDKYDALLPCDKQFIGVLQTNKVKYLIGRVSLIQSVSSVHLAQEISRLSQKAGVITPILLEVNVGKEASKSGFLPEELEENVASVAALPGLRIDGLMAIPPICDQKAQLEQYFSVMNEYFIDIKSKKSDNVNMNILSMGMSADYETAITCGATMVRIGSLLFGSRILHH